MVFLCAIVFQFPYRSCALIKSTKFCLLLFFFPLFRFRFSIGRPIDRKLTFVWLLFYLFEFFKMCTLLSLGGVGYLLPWLLVFFIYKKKLQQKKGLTLLVFFRCSLNSECVSGLFTFRSYIFLRATDRHAVL